MACIVVVYHFKINEQTHYIHHDAEVSAVCVSKNGLVASGERGKNPSIHVWRVQDLKPIHILKGQHRCDIYLFAFVNNDKYLVSCGKRLDTSVIIYNLEDGSIVLSTHVE